MASDRFKYNGINHLAFVCRDMAETVAFWEGILEMPLVCTLDLPLDGQHTVFGESFTIFGFGFDAGSAGDSDAMLQDVVSTEQLRSGFTDHGRSPSRADCIRRKSPDPLRRRSPRYLPGSFPMSGEY